MWTQYTTHAYHPPGRHPLHSRYTGIGYTAMMQANQTTAMAMVKQYEEVLRDRITRHSGELLQTYGDGSLNVLAGDSPTIIPDKEFQNHA